MKNLLIGILFSSIGVQAACLPEAPFLNHKSRLMSLNLNMKGIEEAASEFEGQILRELPTGQDLVINLEPQNPRVNAEIKKNDSEIVVSVWGGMLGHPLMTPDAFTLLLCHEIGHLLGGPPLKSRNGWSSTEGQADYYSGICARSFEFDSARFMDAALNLTKIYAQVSNQVEPELDSCDTSLATRTNYGHPKAQCRLDTLLAGWREQPRPSCWFVQ